MRPKWNESDGGDDFRARQHRNSGARDQTGAFDFIEKPFSLEKLFLSSRMLSKSTGWNRRNRRLREELSGPRSCTATVWPIRALRQQIALTAPTNGRVLIYGESGTGKRIGGARAACREPAQRSGVRRSELRRPSRRS